MEESEVRIEADRAEGGEAILGQESVVEREQSVDLVRELGANDGFGERERFNGIGKTFVLRDLQADVFERRRLHGSDEAAVAGDVDDWDLVGGQRFDRLRGDLHVAKRNDLANGRHWDAIDLLAVFLDDEMLAALADKAAGILQINDAPSSDWGMTRGMPASGMGETWPGLVASRAVQFLVVGPELAFGCDSKSEASLSL